jgi:Tol biopolymer transport system component
VDRSGKELATVIPSGAQRSIGLSPDGKIVAFSGPDGLVLRDLIRGVDTRFTFPPLVGTAPVWSPDSTRLVFSHANTLYVKDANGSAQETLLFENANTKNPTDWSSDARFLLYTETDPKTGTDLWVLPDPLSQIRNRRPTKFLSTEFNESSGQFSPDGRWLAYVSDESGQPEVYVRPFPPASGKWKVSTNRAIQPRWRRDGKELYYMEGGALFRWMAVPVTSGRSGIFDTGEPISLFLRRVAINPSADVFAYNPDADGRRFLVNTRIASDPTLNVITNWEKASARPLEEP